MLGKVENAIYEIARFSYSLVSILLHLWYVVFFVVWSLKKHCKFILEIFEKHWVVERVIKSGSDVKDREWMSWFFNLNCRSMYFDYSFFFFLFFSLADILELLYIIYNFEQFSGIISTEFLLCVLLFTYNTMYVVHFEINSQEFL